jgi:hypothetical protein
MPTVTVLALLGAVGTVGLCVVYLWSKDPRRRKRAWQLLLLIRGVPVGEFDAETRGALRSVSQTAYDQSSNGAAFTDATIAVQGPPTDRLSESG